MQFDQCENTKLLKEGKCHECEYAQPDRDWCIDLHREFSGYIQKLNVQIEEYTKLEVGNHVEHVAASIAKYALELALVLFITEGMEE